ncbi:MAG: hypothetical protein LBD31_08495, partial [Treponema sp.]|nr:hypothetical protein [Treponema sp.]
SGLPALIGNMAGGALAETAGYRGLFIVDAAVSAGAFLFYGIRRIPGILRIPGISKKGSLRRG